MSVRRHTSNAFKQLSLFDHSSSLAVENDAREELPLEQRARKLLVKGYMMDAAGLTDAADSLYQQTIQYLEIYQADSTHHVTGFFIGRVALRHGIHLFKLNRFAEARAAFNEAVVRFEAMLSYDTSLQTIDRLATALRWLANSKRLMGDLAGARAGYLRSIALYRQLLAFTPKQKIHLVYDRLMHSAIIGLGKTIRLQREQSPGARIRRRSRKRAPA